MRDRTKIVLLLGMILSAANLATLGCLAERSSKQMSPFYLKHIQSIPTEVKFIDRTGKVAFEPGPNVTLGERYSDGLLIVNSSEGRGTNCGNGRTQYWTPEGELAFDAPFADGFSSSEGLCPVRKEQNWGYVDHTGKIVIPLTRDYFEVTPFHDSRAAIRTRDGWGFIDCRGSLVIKPAYKNCLPFSEGLAAVVVDNKIGFIDLDGKMIITPTFLRARSFSEGLAWVSTEKAGLLDFGRFIDKAGKTIIGFDDPKSEAGLNQRIPLPFISRDESTLEVGGLVFCRGSSPTEDSDFHEGLLPSALGEGFGYRDRDGNIAIRSKFKDALRFSGGLAAVSDGKKYGFINRTGSFVIAPTYKIAKTFSEGLAAVSTDGKYFGWIDTKGNPVIPEKFLKVGMFHNGRAKVEVEK